MKTVRIAVASSFTTTSKLQPALNSFRLLRCDGFASPSTPIAVVVSAVPFLLFLVVYGANETLRILPTYSTVLGDPSIRIFDVAAWEMTFFQSPPNELVSSVHCLPLDFLAAVPYLGHYVLPVAYPALVGVSGHPGSARRFYHLVGGTVWTLYAVWYLVPTAPPWYRDVVAGAPAAARPAATVARRRDVLREGAAFARVDRALGVRFFRSLFARNPVPFAAFPSGHVAWPLCVVMSLPPTWRRGPFVAYSLLMVWATMYSRHHYISDAAAAAVVVVAVARTSVWIGAMLTTKKSANATQITAVVHRPIWLP